MLFLVTRPRYDLVTHYFYHWTALLLVEADRKRIQYIDLEKGKVEKTRVQSYIRKRSPNVVIFNGHGSDDAIAGDDDKGIASVADDLGIFSNKTVYIRSCSSGKSLGPEMVKKGAYGFVGYQESFVFVSQPEFFKDPVSDDIAAICLAPSNKIAEALIGGATAKEAHDEGVRASKEKLANLQTSSSYDSQFAPFLFWNMVNQVCYE